MTPQRAEPSVWVTLKAKAFSFIENGQFTIAPRRAENSRDRRDVLTAGAMANGGIRVSVPGKGAADGLTSAAQLSAIYDTILDARFDEARTELAAACPPAPVAACDALREVALWWEIQQNQGSRVLDVRLQAAATTAIASSTRWTEREPEAARRGSTWRVRTPPLLMAGVARRTTDGRARRQAHQGCARTRTCPRPQPAGRLVRNQALHYYADVAPAALKFLRFLLLLPGGDRVEGLQEMLRARDRGQLLRGEADYQLHWLYLWYESKPERALDLLKGLDARHPTNPLFLQRIADVQHVYFSDHQGKCGELEGAVGPRGRFARRVRTDGRHTRTSVSRQN